MHEVALATSLVKIVVRAAAGRQVSQIRLQVGDARQVVDPALRTAFGFVADGTLAESAELVIERVPVVVECPAGHRTTPHEIFSVICARCHTPAAIVSGEEFRVLDILVDDSPADTELNAQEEDSHGTFSPPR